MEELTSEQAAKVERLVNLGLTREQAVAIATERQPDEAVAGPGKHAPPLLDK